MFSGYESVKATRQLKHYVSQLIIATWLNNAQHEQGKSLGLETSFADAFSCICMQVVLRLMTDGLPCP